MRSSETRLQTALEIGLWDRIDELSDDALGENSDSDVAVYAKGLAAMRRREYAEAKCHFQAGLSRDPEIPQLSHGLAICDFVENNIQKAEDRIRSVLNLHPDYFDGQVFLCWILAKSHQVARSRFEIEFALKTHPEHPSLLEALLYLRRNVERRRDTDDLVRRLLAVKPESFLGHLLLAENLIRENRPSEAETEIRYCLSKLPHANEDLRRLLCRLLRVAKLMRNPLGCLPLLGLAFWGRLTRIIMWPKIRRIGREPKFNR